MRYKQRFKLSDRDLAVLYGIMRGERDGEIADELGVSVSTVRKSGTTLRKTFHARTRTEVAVLAMRFGVIVYPQ